MDWVLGRRRPEGPPPGSPAAVAAAAEAAAALAAWEAEEEEIEEYEYEEEEAYAVPYRFAKLLIAGGAPLPPPACLGGWGGQHWRLAPSLASGSEGSRGCLQTSI